MTMTETKSSRRIADFFKSEYARMISFVRGRIADAADRDVEDVVQDVMLRVFDAADMTAPVEDLSAYVYRALRNRIIDLLRRRRDEISLDAEGGPDSRGSLVEVLADARYDTAAEFEHGELLASVAEIIDSLDEAEKEIIVLTEFEGRTFASLAEEKGVPVGTLLSRKSRALKKVRRELFEEYGIMPEE